MSTEQAPSARPPQPMVEIGVSGLKRWGGFIDEEFLAELRGRRGMKVYREMRDNASIIGACLGAIEMLCRQVPWSVEPFSQDNEDLERAAHVESCRQDMSATWADTLAEHLTMLPYGWAFHEIVYKVRGGDVNDPTRRSKHDDRRFGWRKLPLRAQETLAEWDLDPAGGVRAMVQQSAPDYRRRPIPIQKGLLFRARVEKNNPEGRSILRNAYFSWYFEKKIAEIEGIGIARDLAGLPIGWIPAECFAEGATEDQKATKTAMEEIVRNVQRDEQEGIVLPLEYNSGTSNKRYDLTLLSTGGRRQFDTTAIRQGYKTAIAQTMLHDLVLMGQPNTLQYKGTSVPNLFAIALGGWLDAIADVYNAYAIPRLFALNGWETDRCPRLVHGDVEAPNLAALADYISKLSGAGFHWEEDAGVDAHLRKVAGIPKGSDAPTGTTAREGDDPPPPPQEDGPGTNREASVSVPEDDPPLRVSEAAELLGCSPNHVRKLVREGALTAVSLPGFRERRIPAADVRHLLQERE